MRVRVPLVSLPDDLHKRAGLDIKCDTLAHSLRRAAREGKVSVEYKPDSRGVSIAYYRGNPDYKPQERPVKAKDSPPLFFYTLRNTMVPSPYFESLEAIIDDVHQKFGDMRVMPDYKVWTGSFERPYPVEAE